MLNKIEHNSKVKSPATQHFSRVGVEEHHNGTPEAPLQHGLTTAAVASKSTAIAKVHRRTQTTQKGHDPSQGVTCRTVVLHGPSADKPINARPLAGWSQNIPVDRSIQSGISRQGGKKVRTGIKPRVAFGRWPTQSMATLCWSSRNREGSTATPIRVQFCLAVRCVLRHLPNVRACTKYRQRTSLTATPQHTTTLPKVQHSVSSLTPPSRSASTGRRPLRAEPTPTDRDRLRTRSAWPPTQGLPSTPSPRLRPLLY